MILKDYYNLLDVEFNSEPHEIKSAFRRQALKYHPDVNQDKYAHDLFFDIQEAYQILMNPVKRKVYNIKYKVVYLSDVN